MIQKFTKEQALVIMGFTGKTTLPFSDFHEDVEKRLKRPIFTHEFADEDVFQEIQDVYREDFIAMCPIKD